MKEVEIKTNLDNQTEEVVQVGQEKKEVLAGRIKPHKGHILFEINLSTQEIKEAEFEENDEVTFNPEGKEVIRKNKKVVMNDNCVYISALNKINAVKKFVRGKTGSKR